MQEHIVSTQVHEPRFADLLKELLAYYSIGLLTGATATLLFVIFRH